MSVSTEINNTGESSATTLPASMGLLAPDVSTVMTPSLSFEVAMSQAGILQQSPRTGERVAAHLFWPFHIKVRVAGRTAEEMMTPMKTYSHPILYVVSQRPCRAQKTLRLPDASIVQSSRKGSHDEAKATYTDVTGVNEAFTARLGVDVCAY
jgi:hypothetical protein